MYIKNTKTQEVIEMRKQTFIDNMTERGYDIALTPTGNVTATKGVMTVRLVPLASYGVHIDTPTVTAITAKNATDTETMFTIDILTIQP